ncbi:hypothetical protein D9V29_11395 [Mycetocola manganoxydans]|uniref:Uncharacterized protein n=1 Tax=Mycetocola manganoxydans TaxID=699879 RepID=A0A3L6ZPR1_9MICO|nr:hypothetical protein D9V29_11395 [Mycetocola manganoxydans]
MHPGFHWVHQRYLSGMPARSVQRQRVPGDAAHSRRLMTSRNRDMECLGVLERARKWHPIDQRSGHRTNDTVRRHQWREHPAAIENGCCAQLNSTDPSVRRLEIRTTKPTRG